MTAAVSTARGGPCRAQRRIARTQELLIAAAATTNEQRRVVLLGEVIVLHIDLAHAEASRYRSRGVPLDDLRQVAALALTKAAHGFDPSCGTDFLAYAIPTIRGELRKHFRDHGWMIRPPRRIQELQARISTAEADLSARLGRSPQPADIAQHLGESTEAVIEALASDGCFTPASLDHPVGADGAHTLGDLLATDDLEQQSAEARLVLAPLVRHLSDRDQLILQLRFFHGLTQREIATAVGVTQMQVSRLLTRILAQLRHEMGELPDHPDTPC